MIKLIHCFSLSNDVLIGEMNFVSKQNETNVTVACERIAAGSFKSPWCDIWSLVNAPYFRGLIRDQTTPVNILIIG